MVSRKTAPYGSWKSPITANMIVTDAVSLGQIRLDGGDVYWSETRPTENGRNVIVRRQASGRIEDLLPLPYNARTRVHEYGGGAYTVSEGTVYFTNFADQRIYCFTPGTEPVPVTPAGDYRFADMLVDRARGRLIAVCEDHRRASVPVNTIVAILYAETSAGVSPPEGIHVLASGDDFYASPRLSPDGNRLAWLSWNHPNMPWDGTELWLAELDADGRPGNCRRIAGGDEESVFHPLFSPDGLLYFISDRSNWWNLYRWRQDRAEPVATMEAEFGLPQWQFGMSTCAFNSADRLVCAYNEAGSWSLGVVDTHRQKCIRIDTPYSDIASVNAADGQAYVIAGSAAEPPSIVRIDLGDGRREVLRASTVVEVGLHYLSVPEAMSFPTSQHELAYGFFYPPHNKDFQAPAEERPPLLVISHGGPTAATSSGLSLKIQYWTSRGFAVFDVNYRGSTGYGRAYRRRLYGGWGVLDVDDCIHGAKTLADRGVVDADRMAIRGSSAGGYTTLCALVFHDVFKAGASYYGVSDLEALAAETHKFEAHYLDQLIGPYPQQRERYRARSPIHYVERLTCPVIFFQGLDDKVVPPDQTERMVDALRTKDLPVSYMAFPQEQHGFRLAETIKRALEGELYFYSRLFDFQPADDIAPVAVENL